jgi:hypothetical protein
MKFQVFKSSLVLMPLLVNLVSSLVAQPLLKLPDVASRQELMPPNGWGLFEQAGKALQGNESPLRVVQKPEEATQLLALKRAYVAQNKEALRLIKEALHAASHRPPTHDMEGDSRARKLGRLLTYKAQIAAADENWDEAKNTLLDVMRLGIYSSRGGVLVSHINGLIMQQDSHAELKKIMPRLSANQLRELAKMLESLHAARLTYSESLEAETWLGLSTLQEMLTDASWGTLRTNPQLLKTIFEDATAEQIAHIHKRSDRQIIVDYLTAMDAFVEASRVPYMQQPDFKPPALDAFSVLYSGVATTREGRLSFERNDMQTALLLTQTALRGHHLEKGAYPDTLQDLVPNYLTNAPLDPFDVQKPLRYHRVGDSYLLYSIGPDGVDNKGVPIDNQPPLVKTINEKTRRHILLDSKGDIVEEPLK